MTQFSDLGLPDTLLRALADMGFEKPSAIQEKTIPSLLEGEDLIGQAQTGTGKTAAFALPMLARLKDVRDTQGIVIAPTRELAIQVAEQIVQLSKYMPKVTVVVLCGGQEYSGQVKALRDNATIVVGTPGRVLDLIQRGALKLKSITTCVLDEADEMFRRGFEDEMKKLLAMLPPSRQTVLFSATMPPAIRRIAEQYLRNPVSVEIRSETATVQTIEQRFIFASPPQKPEALTRVLSVENYQGVIVFVRTKSSSDEVAQQLQQQGYRAMSINGDMTQVLRERVIAQFREGAIDILVATDVAARGLDVERVSHVINYDVPHDCETYVHRVGRTGRAGRSGITILFVTPREARILSAIERHTRQPIQKVMVPTNEAILEARQTRFIEGIVQRVTHANIQSYRDIVQKFAEENPETSLVDVAAALALQLHKDKPWQRESKFTSFDPGPSRDQGPSRHANSRGSRESRPRFDRERPPRDAGGFGAGSRPSRPNSGPSTPRTYESAGSGSTSPVQAAMFRLDVGRLHGVKPGNIVGAIANEAGLHSRDITALKIHDDHSTVRLPKAMPKKAVQALKNAWVCGRPLNLTAID